MEPSALKVVAKQVQILVKVLTHAWVYALKIHLAQYKLIAAQKLQLLQRYSHTMVN